ncbi:DUF3408 domain-containing protein [Bacteroides reticulotermitis]|uniref:DUF3408 domain-containing protein n=1 Tax=Bacteroides reticulotermitis TaxID=1133319 RepID=UPI003A8771E9
MAKKKIVEIDEEMLKGIMVSDVPVFGRVSQTPELSKTVEPEAEPTEVPAITEPVKKQRTQRNPYRRKKEESSEYRDKYLVNTPAPARVQTYINRESYARIRRFLTVIAPDVSIASYVNNILSEHLEKHWDEINDMYDQSLNQLNKPW